MRVPVCSAPSAVAHSLLAAYCAYLWINGQTGGAIVMTIFAVLSIISYFFLRKRCVHRRRRPMIPC